MAVSLKGGMGGRAGGGRGWGWERTGAHQARAPWRPAWARPFGGTLSRRPDALSPSLPECDVPAESPAGHDAGAGGRARGAAPSGVAWAPAMSLRGGHVGAALRQGPHRHPSSRWLCADSALLRPLWPQPSSLAAAPRHAPALHPFPAGLSSGSQPGPPACGPASAASPSLFPGAPPPPVLYFEPCRPCSGISVTLL